MADAGDPVRRQLALNRSVADHWDLFAVHRRRVTNLLANRRAAIPGSLFVLGAGNCNDLDLRRLSRSFDEIHLADLDIAAVRAGIRRQAPVDGVIRPHRVDLSGIAEPLRRWATSPPSNAEIDRALLRLGDGVARRWPRRAGGAVAASTGLLSQMTAMAIRTLGADHPRAVEVALAIRDAHLRHLVRILAPSGTGVIVTDIASTGAGGDRHDVDQEDPASLAERLVDAGTVTTGTNPLGIVASLRAQRDAAITNVAHHRPWLWTLTPSEPRLVVAISFRRAHVADPLRRRSPTYVDSGRHRTSGLGRSMPRR